MAITAAAFVASPVLANKDYKDHKHMKHHKFHEPVEKVVEVEKGNPFDGPFIGASLGMGVLTGHQTNKSVSNNGNVLQNGNGRVAALGVLGGLNIGWDKVFKGRWLAGIDIFGDLSSTEGDFKSRANQARGDAFISNSKIKTDYTVGAGIKLGAIVKNVLLYTTVHWVGSNFKVSGLVQNALVANVPAPNTVTFGTPYTARKKEFKSGVRAGLGMMMPVTDKIVFGMEAGYSWYESIKARATVNDGLGAAFSPTTTSFKNKPEMLDVKAKIAWKFRGIS